MNTATIVQKLWNYCNVLRDDGMSYGYYVEQLTYLLFLKMAGERTQAPYNRQEARLRDAVDEEALDLRSADQQALHAEDEFPQARGPGRVRRPLQPEEPPRAQSHVVGEEPRRPLARLRLRGTCRTRQGEPRHLLAQGRIAGGL